MTVDARERGFTLLELLVVLAIMGLLAAVVGPAVLNYLSGAKTKVAQVQIKAIADSMDTFRIDAGRLPTQAEGLQALVTAPPSLPTWNGPYLGKASGLTDPWGQPYRFKVPGAHGEFDIYSYGSDNAEGGTGEARDVGNW